MSEDHPTWARTARQTPIELVSSHPLEQLERPVLFIGGVHGDEPLGVRLAVDFLPWLRAQKATEISSWIMIPCINPDGFKAGTRVNGNGVDLNRNYPASNWSHEARAPRYSPGPHAGSELEIQALVRLITQVHPQLIVHFHSWKPCIVATGEPAKASAQLLAQCSGYELVKTIGYDTPGSLSQFGWYDQKIPVICIEESDDATPESTWPRFQPGLSALCRLRR
jgi:predicted deacylase